VERSVGGFKAIATGVQGSSLERKNEGVRRSERGAAAPRLSFLVALFLLFPKK
jgi:hypothetical protein